MEKDLVEIRWHGRGGQGAVTSAEMIALAAFEEGKYAQAFPSFGPERRGAPVIAFNRISKKDPIENRTEVDHPDIVVVFAQSLLSIVDVTAGLKDDGIIVVNSSQTFEEIQKITGRRWKLAIVNASAIAKEMIKADIVNTTMLGALVKVSEAVKMESLEIPLEERFGARGKANFSSAKKAYEQTVISVKINKDEIIKKRNVDKLPGWKDMTIGCSVMTPGNAKEYRTGDWRSQHPVWNNAKCIKCGLCYMYCPEFCISQRQDEYFEADLFYCKGCGICPQECPTQAISMVQE
jgi:pyruvate ferredoxin oxidoreductase gamma subunit